SLSLYGLDGARELGTPRVGHDAESAELVTALLHGEECRDRFDRCASRQRRELILFGEAGFDDPALARRGAGNKVAQTVIALRTYDYVDHRRAAQDLRALRLRHAAGNRDDRL